MENSANSQNTNYTKFRFIILLFLWVIAFYPILPGLLSTWVNHSNNSYGMLVPLISLYFIWQKKRRLRLDQVAHSNWGVVIFISSIVVYLLSYAGDVAVIARSMMVFSLMGLVLFTLGKKNFKQLLFPLLFLLFMVPIPDSILIEVGLPLQLIASDISALVLRTLSIPVYQEGNMLYFAQTQLEVAEACSGIRSISALVMLSVIFCHVLRHSWWKKSILLLSTVPLGMLLNIIRVSSIGLLAHFFGANVARGFLHEFSGIAIFITAFIVLYLEFSLVSRIGVTSKTP